MLLPLGIMVCLPLLSVLIVCFTIHREFLMLLLIVFVALTPAIVPLCIYFFFRIRAERYVCDSGEIWVYVGVHDREIFVEGRVLKMGTRVFSRGHVFRDGGMLLATRNMFNRLKLFYNGERLYKEKSRKNFVK